TDDHVHTTLVGLRLWRRKPPDSKEPKMRSIRVLVLLAVALVGASPARAWNGTGHMVVALLACRDLKENKPAVLAKVHDLLKKHPHYEEYGRADRPASVGEMEWVFLRAATWPDWVRPPSPYQEFHVGDRHFINRPLVREDDEDKVDQDAVKEVKEENVLNG